MMEWDETAALVTAGMAAIMALFFFADPIDAGFENLSIGIRIIALLMCLPVGYFVAYRVINK